MNLFKNQKIGFWAYLILEILTIVSLVVYVSNVNSAYYQDMKVNIVVLLVSAIVLIAGVLLLPQFWQNSMIKIITDIFSVAVAALLIVVSIKFVGMRVESFGYIFGSNLELGNEAAQTAGSQAIMGIILLFVTWAVSIIASFLDVGKKSKIVIK